MASQTDHMANLAIINRNYRDDTIYDIHPDKWNKYVKTGSRKRSGIIIHACVGGEYKETDINLVDGNGIGVRIFVCPYPGCNMHLSRRHTGVQRHFENCHEKAGDPAGAIAQGMKWWSHVTVASYTTWGQNGRGLTMNQKRERLRKMVADKEAESSVPVQNEMNMAATAPVGPATYLHTNQQYGVQNQVQDNVGYAGQQQTQQAQVFARQPNQNYAGLPGQQMLPPPVPNTNMNAGPGSVGNSQFQGMTTYDFYDGTQMQLDFPWHPMLLDPEIFTNPSGFREMQRTHQYRINLPYGTQYGRETELYFNPVANQVPPGFNRRDDEVHSCDAELHSMGSQPLQAESQMNLAQQQNDLGHQALGQRQITPAEMALASVSAIPQTPTQVPQTPTLPMHNRVNRQSADFLSRQPAENEVAPTPSPQTFNMEPSGLLTHSSQNREPSTPMHLQMDNLTLQEQPKALTQADEGWWANGPQQEGSQFQYQMTEQDQAIFEEWDREFARMNGA